MIREGVHTDQRMLVVSYHAANCTANPDWHQAREALCEQLRTDDLITSQAHTVCLIANDGKADIL